MRRQLGVPSLLTGSVALGAHSGWDFDWYWSLGIRPVNEITAEPAFQAH